MFNLFKKKDVLLENTKEMLEGEVFIEAKPLKTRTSISFHKVIWVGRSKFEDNGRRIDCGLIYRFDPKQSESRSQNVHWMPAATLLKKIESEGWRTA